MLGLDRRSVRSGLKPFKVDKDTTASIKRQIRTHQRQFIRIVDVPAAILRLLKIPNAPSDFLRKYMLYFSEFIEEEPAAEHEQPVTVALAEPAPGPIKKRSRGDYESESNSSAASSAESEPPEALPLDAVLEKQMKLVSAQLLQTVRATAREELRAELRAEMQAELRAEFAAKLHALVNTHYK
jgi:hypothetical protein